MSEENKKIFQKENSSKGKHEIVFPDEKLEDEGKVLTVYEEEIPIDRGNKCNELNTSVILNTQKIESTINSCVMSTDIPNIIRDNNRMQVNNLLTQKQECNKKSSLSIIAAEYGDSDSDMEEIEADSTTENQYSVSQIEIQNLQQYRTVKKNLSDEEVDSEDDSSSVNSSSSSSSSSSSNININDSSNDSDSDDTANIKKNESKANITKKTKYVQNELDDLPPIEDLQISVPEVLCNPLGKVEKIVEQLVVIKPKPGEPTLNLDTILFVNKGTKALGKIFDVFGSVSEPHYCVRFNDAKHIQDNDIKVGMQVYYCPSNTSYTSFVFLHELTKIKACDAIGDDEPPAFSDDEEEQAYYEMLKQKNKDCSDGKTSQKKHQTKSATMGWQSNNPWNMNRKVQPQRNNWKRQQNWRGDNRFNSAQNEPYSCNESWQQYPYQNNYWQPVPQTMYPMPRSYAGYRMPYNRPQLPQYGNSSNSDGTNQYYQGAETNFQINNIQSQYPRALFGAPPRFNPPYPSVGTNCHQFSNAPFSYMNTSYPTYSQSLVPMTDANAYWSPPGPSSIPPLDTKNVTSDVKNAITDRNSSK